MEYGEKNTGPYAAFFKTTKDRTCVEHLTDEEIKVLEETVKDWGFEATEKIVEATKETEPCIETGFGDVIDLDKYKKEMDLIYRNKELLTSVKKSMLEARQRKGVLCTTPEEIDSYFESL